MCTFLSISNIHILCYIYIKFITLPFKPYGTDFHWNDFILAYSCLMMI